MPAGILDISVRYRTISVESPVLPGSSVLLGAVVQLVEVRTAQPETVPAGVGAISVEGVTVKLTLREQKHAYSVGC